VSRSGGRWRTQRVVVLDLQSTFLFIEMLRDGGMPLRNLNVIYNALVINRITYCLSACAGFLSPMHVDELN
jgi:hypothetical protein